MVKTSDLWDVSDKVAKIRRPKLTAMPEGFIKGVDRFIELGVAREYVYECVDRLYDTAFLTEPDGSQFVEMPLEDKLELSLGEIPLSLRTINALEESGICLVGELLGRTVDQILATVNLDKVGLEEIYTALEAIGIYRPSRLVPSTNGFTDFQAMCKRVGEVRE